MSLLSSHIFLNGVEVLPAARKALYDLPSPNVPVLTSSTPPSPTGSSHPGLPRASYAPGASYPGLLHVLCLYLRQLHG